MFRNLKSVANCIGVYYWKSLLWCVLVVFLVACQKPSQTTGTISSVSFTEISSQNGVPVWHELEPGHAQKKDVLEKLGEPYRTQHHGSIELMFYGQEGKCENRTEICHRVALRDGKVETIVLMLLDSDVATLYTTVGDVVAALGSPVAIKENTLTYPQLGMTFVVYEDRLFPTDSCKDRTYNQICIHKSRKLRFQEIEIYDHIVIDYVMLYAPTTLDQYNRMLGSFHPLDNPWVSPIPSRVDLVKIIPGMTTNEDVVALLGEPDLEGFASQFSQYYAIYRIPGMADDYVIKVFFDRQQIVQAISGHISDEADYRVQDAIALYGIPDLIQGYCWGDNPPSTSPLHDFVWLDEGLLYGAIKPPRDTNCSQVSRLSRALPPDCLHTRPDPCPGPEDIVWYFARFIPTASQEFEAPTQLLWDPE